MQHYYSIQCDPYETMCGSYSVYVTYADTCLIFDNKTIDLQNCNP